MNASVDHPPIARAENRAEKPVSSLQHADEGVDVERIDAAVLNLVSWLLPNLPLCGLDFLALLCRRAQEKQLPLFDEVRPVGVVTFHGARDLCHNPAWEWRWGYHATQRYLVVLDALTVFSRTRIDGITRLHIPLGPRTLDKEAILKNLATAHRTHKDKKTRQLIERVRQQIERYGLPSGDSLKPSLDAKTISTLCETLVSMMQTEGLPKKKSQRIAQWFVREQVCTVWQQQEATLGDSQTSQPHHEGEREHSPRPPSTTMGDSAIGSMASRIATRTHAKAQKSSASSSSKLGDCGAQEGRFLEETGDCGAVNSHDQTGSSRAPSSSESPVSSEKATAPSMNENPVRDQKDAQCASLTHGSGPESPTSQLEEIPSHELGDSGACLSISISPSLEKPSLGKRTDIDNNSPQTEESPCCEESLLAEATWIAIELDGEESFRLNRGRGWIGAYKKKLQKHPYLVRVSLIDMYMQQLFPDWQGMPRGRGGQWFNIRYKAYTESHESVSVEIESWARSRYSYEQIKEALHLERQRQDNEIADLGRRNVLYTGTVVRPNADCVAIYGHLGDCGKGPDEGAEQEQMRARTHGQADQMEESLRVSNDGTLVELEDGEVVSVQEYEWLVWESELLADTSPVALWADDSSQTQQLLQRAAEQAHVLWVSEQDLQWRLAHLPRAIRRDIVQLQRLLPNNQYSVEPVVTPRGNIAIHVENLSDATDGVLLRSVEQTNILMKHLLEEREREEAGEGEVLQSPSDPR